MAWEGDGVEWILIYSFAINYNLQTNTVYDFDLLNECCSVVCLVFLLNVIKSVFIDLENELNATIMATVNLHAFTVYLIHD